jgi:uncharacterized membrane protein YjjP (DUF1212 family)
MKHVYNMANILDISITYLKILLQAGTEYYRQEDETSVSLTS